MENLDAKSLQAVMSKVKYLLLDFDGPICDIFAGLPAPEVAARLRVALEESGAELPGEVHDMDDPLEVFKFSASIGDRLNVLALEILAELEVKASETARLTPGASDLMRNARRNGMSIAIVSNNSVAAVTAFLEREDLNGQVSYISARSAADPSLMKPNPHLLDQALSYLGADPSSAMLVGDSVTDMEVATLSGVVAVGFANRPEKVKRLADAGADHIVTDMRELAASLA
ncbi:HAD family hydrolase [Herbidospora cretacea]|uniref:HAD family hydrolase n=1 Tax=Herbidospora cretacea TaxID=28444 RepID=UPI00068C943B|nr:HAD-IIIA family hydrolase [Herbidospora cretacea]